MENIGWLLTLGVGIFLVASGLGVAMLALVIWGVVNVVKRLTGGSSRKKSLPGDSGAARIEQPAVQPQVARDYEYLDVEEGATAQSVIDAMSPYEGMPYVGEYARSAVSTLKKADFRREGLFDAIDREFGPNTLTWDKFAAPIEVAMDGILRNCVQIANRAQGFDTAEYGRLLRLKNAGAFSEGSNNHKKFELMQNALTEMQELSQTNDQLLFELDKLQDELTKLGGSDGGTPDDEIAEEIRKLSEEAKYYS